MSAKSSKADGARGIPNRGKNYLLRSFGSIVLACAGLGAMAHAFAASPNAPTYNFTPPNGAPITASSGPGDLTLSAFNPGTPDTLNCSFMVGSTKVIAPNSVAIPPSTTNQAFDILCMAGDSSTETLTCQEMGGTQLFSWPVTCSTDTPPTVTYVPTIGSTVTLAAGAASITVTSNADGSGIGPPASTGVGNCMITGAGATAFGPVTVSPTNPIVFNANVPGSGSIGLTCTQSASLASATLTCDQLSGLGMPMPNTWPINCPALAGALSIISTPPTSATLGVFIPSSAPFVASGGSPPYGNWIVTAGTLPPGLTLSPTTGSLSGTPNTPGVFTSTVQVTDMLGATASTPFSMTIGGALAIFTISPLPNGMVGVPSTSGPLTAIGGIPPYTNWIVTSGALPPGLSMVPATGSLVGTPTTAGTYNFTVQVTDSAPATASKPFVLTIDPAAGMVNCPPIAVSQTATSGFTGNTITLTTQTSGTNLSGAVETFSWQISSGDASFSNGSSSIIDPGVAYVPSGGGTFTATSSKTITLGINASPVTVRIGTDSCPTPATFTVNNMGPLTVGQLTRTGGDRQTGPVGSTLPLPLQVNAADSQGSPAAGVPVTFVITSGDATFVQSGTSSVTLMTAASGTAQVNLRLGNIAGAVTIDASAPQFGATSFFETATPAPTAYALEIVSGNAQAGTTGTDGAPLVVSLTRNGLLQSGQAIDWVINSGLGIVSLATSTSATGSNGRASNTVHFSSTPGQAIVQAQLQSDPSVQVSFQLSSTAPSGGTSVLNLVSGSGQTGAINTDADAPFVFALTSGGQALGSLPITFSIIAGSGTLSTQSAFSDAQGRVSTLLHYGNQAGPVTVQASAFSGNLTASATATAFVPTATAFAGNNQTAPAGSRLPQPLTICLCTSSGQPSIAKGLAGVVVTWSVVSGGGSLGSTTTTADAGGKSSNTFTLGPAVGTQQVRASIPGGSSVTFVATATATGTVVFEIVSGNNQSLPTGAQAGDPLVVRLRTTLNNPLAGVAVQFSANPAAAVTLSAAQVVTDSSGLASVRVAMNLPIAAQVVASVPSLSGTTPLSFTITGGTANTPGLTPEQRSVATAIDAACPALFTSGTPLSAGQQDLLARCSELVGSSGGRPGDVQAALRQLTNDEGAAQTGAAKTSASAQFDNLKARIAALRSGARGVSLGGLAIASSTGVLPLSALPSSIIANSKSAAEQKEDEVGSDFSRWGFFATGTITQGDRDASSGSAGYSFGSRGLTAGVDYRYSDKAVFGAAVGYSNSDTSLDGGQGKLNSHGVSFSGYGTFYQGTSYYTDAVLTYGSNTYELSRKIQYSINSSSGTTQVNQTAKGSPDGNQFSFALTAGRDFTRGAWSFGPYIRGTYTKIDFDSYVERMSNPGSAGSGLALAVDSRSLTSREGVLGGKISYTASTSWGVISPNMQLEYLHEFASDPDNLVSHFANDPTGSPIVVAGQTDDRQYFNLGIGLSAVFANGRSAFAYLEHRAGQSGVNQDSLALGVRIEF